MLPPPGLGVCINYVELCVEYGLYSGEKYDICELITLIASSRHDLE